MHDLFNGLLLNPRMNARYEMKVSKMLEKAITKLENIEAVRYVKCVFPSVASEAPKLSHQQRQMRTILGKLKWYEKVTPSLVHICLLYTSDAADE